MIIALPSCRMISEGKTAAGWTDNFQSQLGGAGVKPDCQRGSVE
jgi:hypothetical protein